MGVVIFVAFVVSVGYAINRSKRRWRTVLYMLLASIAGFAIYAVSGYFVGLSGYAVGEIGLSVGLLCGALVALVHSRRSNLHATS